MRSRRRWQGHPGVLEVSIDDGRTWSDAGVSIALNMQTLQQCAVLDADRSGNVTINELVAAVNNALHGC